MRRRERGGERVVCVSEGGSLRLLAIVAITSGTKFLGALNWAPGWSTLKRQPNIR